MRIRVHSALAVPTRPHSKTVYGHCPGSIPPPPPPWERPSAFRPSTSQCTAAVCPSDCVMEDWTDWTPCPGLCEGGSQERFRSIRHHPVRRGAPCGATGEARPCVCGTPLPKTLVPRSPAPPLCLCLCRQPLPLAQAQRKAGGRRPDRPRASLGSRTRATHGQPAACRPGPVAAMCTEHDVIQTEVGAHSQAERCNAQQQPPRVPPVEPAHTHVFLTTTTAARKTTERWGPCAYTRPPPEPWAAHMTCVSCRTTANTHSVPGVSHPRIGCIDPVPCG